MTDVGPDPQYSPPVLPAQDAAALAARHGLHQAGVRPGFLEYLRELWHYRHLMWAMAKGEVISEYQDNHLGWLWSIINPILLGVSRKRFIAAVLRRGDLPATARDPGTLAVTLAAVAQGVQIHRVHNVADVAQGLALWRALDPE